MNRPRDTQRQKVYDAERASSAWDLKIPEIPCETVPEMQAFVDRILADRWIRARFSTRSIRVAPGGGQRRALATPLGFNEWRIGMPLWSRRPIVVLHEVAHCLAPWDTAWHGREFAAIYVALVDRYLGDEAAGSLRRMMKARNVKHRSPLPTPKTLPSKKEQAARQAASVAERLDGPKRARLAAEVIRFQVRQGKLGPVGSGSRIAALATARELERLAL